MGNHYLATGLDAIVWFLLLLFLVFDSIARSIQRKLRRTDPAPGTPYKFSQERWDQRKRADGYTSLSTWSLFFFGVISIAGWIWVPGFL